MNQAQAAENREYVRTLLRKRQPGFAAALESAITRPDVCAHCGCPARSALDQVREQCAAAGITAGPGIWRECENGSRVSTCYHTPRCAQMRTGQPAGERPFGRYVLDPEGEQLAAAERADYDAGSE